MTSNTYVSIIINNYNYGTYLDECIESALNQTYSDTEVIVVDDGSTDQSRTIIERYSDRVVPVFKTNGGQASAYNAGFEVSRGEVICFLDSDDILYSTAIDQAMRLFRDDGIVKVQWPLQVVDAQGRSTGKISTTQTPPKGDLRALILREGPLYDFHFTTGSAVRSSFCEKVFPMPEAPYINGADVYLITLAPAYGRIDTLTEPQGTYRAHGNNNYRDRPLTDERIENYIERFEANCRVLEEHLVQQGEEVNAALWRERNFNSLWPRRLLKARREIENVIPPGGTYVLLNEDEWGDREPVSDRHAVPFLERDGVYWGRPPDDDTAVRELQRLYKAGAGYLVVWWTAFWWLESYSGLHRYLRDNASCTVENDAVLIFELTDLAVSPVPESMP